MSKTLKLSPEEEMTLTLKIANMYLDGNSFREIAQQVKLSHVSVRRYLLEKLRHYNPSLANEVLEEINSNTPKSIHDGKVIKRVLTSLSKLVNENKTVEQIAGEMGVSTFTTYRDLTTRLKMLHEVAPENVSEEMLAAAAAVLNSHSLANLENGSMMSAEHQDRDVNGRFV